MLRICVLVAFCLYVAYGYESCDRKIMEDTICSLCGQRKGGQQQETGRQVAFFVYMSQSVMINTLSKYKTFVYDREETNVGNGYNVQSGNFTAPEGGVYVFHTSTAAFDKSHCTIEIVANGEVKDTTWADAMDHNDRAVASSMTVLSLTEGDVVNVRAGLTFAGNHLESNQYTRMTFSGFKLALRKNVTLFFHLCFVFNYMSCFHFLKLKK